MLMKLRIAVVMGVVGLLLSTSVFSPSGDPEVHTVWADASFAHAYSTIEELCGEADIIAVGTVTAIETVNEWIVGETRWGPSVLWSTDFVFTVEQVLRGPENLSGVVINQGGAQGQWEIRSDPLFKIGEQYVVFLHEPIQGGRGITLGGPQGRFRIIADEVFSMLYFVHPELMDYDPEDVAEYLNASEWLRFYLNIKGIDKQTFLAWVIDSIPVIPVSGVEGYVGYSYPPYGTFPLQGANVEVDGEGKETFTDYAGYYQIQLQPGSYTVKAAYLTFKDKIYYNVQVVEGEYTTLNFILEQENPGFPIPMGDPALPL
jgi:hypothetical protein